MTNRKEKIFNLAKGFYGRSKSSWKLANNRVEHGLQHAYKARKQKKRDYRALWIQNVKAATQEFGIKYNQFMYGLALSGCQINRKVLSELAQTEPLSMRSIVELSNQSRRTYQLYLRDQNPELYSRETIDYHSLPFPAEYGTKDFKWISDEMKRQMETVAKNIEVMAKEELAEDAIYEKKLQEHLAKTKIAEPDDDIDI